MNSIKLQQLIRDFLIEDIGYGDKTAESIFGDSIPIVTAQMIAKDHGVFSGSEVIHLFYNQLNEAIETSCKKKEGDIVEKGDVIAEFTGDARTILQGERVLLNIIQRMCGIASIVHQANECLNDSSIRICDTRKTLPGLRMFDKAACRAGGGYNHRFGLDDGVMLKENHIAACGSIKEAVQRVKSILGPMVKIEVETTNQSEVEEAVASGVDVIMFDHATADQVRLYQQFVPETTITEASGNIDLNNIHTFAGTGVHYISLGFLTHSVKALDLSMLLK